MVLSRNLSIATLSALLLGPLGCAPGNPGLDIVGDIAPDDMCVVDPAGTAFIISSTFDLEATFGMPAYGVAFSVQNHLINRFSTSFPVMADVNTITITGAEVELVDRNGRRLAITNSFYRVPAGGTIPSASGDQPGRGVAYATIIPSNVAQQLLTAFENVPAGGGSLVARVAVIGVSQGGSEVISSDFVIPISLCVGCLYSSATPPEDAPTVCNPGQGRTSFVPGYVPPIPCETSEDCASALCSLGRCAP